MLNDTAEDKHSGCVVMKWIKERAMKTGITMQM